MTLYVKILAKLLETVVVLSQADVVYQYRRYYSETTEGREDPADQQLSREYSHSRKIEFREVEHPETQPLLLSMERG